MGYFLQKIILVFLALITAIFLPFKTPVIAPSVPTSFPLTVATTSNQKLSINTSQVSTSSNKVPGETAISTPKPPTPPKKAPEKTLAPPKVNPLPIIPPPVPVSETPLTPLPSLDSLVTDINKKVHGAAVNILCTTKSGGPLAPISGSGIIVDPRGVILTNAHVGQYFLLKNYQVPDFIDCIVRTGTPAYPTYTAKLLYISPRWVKENAQSIVVENPTGTGENDFAFLYITGRIDGSPLPSSFPFIPTRTTDEYYNSGSQVVLAGYPAGFLSSFSIQTNLYITSSVGMIDEIFTFHDGSLDIFSVKGTIVAQKGASGGAVIGMDSKLAGLIVTATDASTTGERFLYALTTNHVERSLSEEMATNMEGLLAGDLQAKVQVFENTMAPTLTAILEAEVNKIQ